MNPALFFREVVPASVSLRKTLVDQTTSLLLACMLTVGPTEQIDQPYIRMPMKSLFSEGVVLDHGYHAESRARARRIWVTV